jgi:hypothetical protein
MTVGSGKSRSRAAPDRATTGSEVGDGFTSGSPPVRIDRSSQLRARSHPYRRCHRRGHDNRRDRALQQRERVTSGQEPDCPAEDRDRAHDDEQRSEEHERAEPPVHLTSQRIWIAFGGAANDELGPSRLSEMKVVTFSLDHIGEPLEQIDQLFIVDRDGRFGERLAAAIFDSHLMPIRSLCDGQRFWRLIGQRTIDLDNRRHLGPDEMNHVDVLVQLILQHDAVHSGVRQYSKPISGLVDDAHHPLIRH